MRSQGGQKEVEGWWAGGGGVAPGCVIDVGAGDEGQGGLAGTRRSGNLIIQCQLHFIHRVGRMRSEWQERVSAARAIIAGRIMLTKLMVWLFALYNVMQAALRLDKPVRSFGLAGG